MLMTFNMVHDGTLPAHDGRIKAVSPNNPKPVEGKVDARRDPALSIRYARYTLNMKAGIHSRGMSVKKSKICSYQFIMKSATDLLPKVSMIEAGGSGK